MKKLFPVLLLAMIIGLFSSCIIVTNDTAKHTITLRNNLEDDEDNDIFDWYAKNMSDQKFAISSTPVGVSSDGGVSRLRDIPQDYYKVIFTFDDTTDNNDNDTYYVSNKFYLDSDKDFILEGRHSSYTATVRSATGTENTVTEKEYQIVDSEGNIFPLTKVSK